MLNKKMTVAAALEQDIADGRLLPGDMIPSRAQLMRRFHCSRSVVERAISDMTERGLLAGRQGKGTFVLSSCAAQKYPIRRVYAVSSYYAKGFKQSFTCLLLDSRDLGLPVEFIPLDRADAECETLCQEDALIVFINPDYEQLPLMHYLKSRHIQLLVINREFDGFNRIVTDIFSGFLDGLEYLESLPGETVSVIGREMQLKYPYQIFRQMYFFRACAEKKMQVNRENVLFLPFKNVAKEITAAEQIFKHLPARIAILNSDLIEPLINFATARGLVPGRDFFVLGFEYLAPVADIPGIAMLRQKYDDFYDKLKEFIAAGGNNCDEPFVLTIPPELIIS